MGGIKDGFNKFQTSLEDSGKKNKENWEETKEKSDKFLKKMKADWEGKTKKWQEDIEQKQMETKEQWNARKEKMNTDFKSWQNNVRDDWNEGLKQWNRSIIRGAWVFLLAMIPIIIVLYVIFAFITPIIPSF